MAEFADNSTSLTPPTGLPVADTGSGLTLTEQVALEAIATRAFEGCGTVRDALDCVWLILVESIHEARISRRTLGDVLWEEALRPHHCPGPFQS